MGLTFDKIMESLKHNLRIGFMSGEVSGESGGV